MSATDPHSLASLDHVSRTRVTVRVGPLVRPALSRVVAIHAARAELPVDRLSDAVLVADALAAQAPGFAVAGRFPLSVQSSPGRLELRIGPLRAGGGRGVLEGAALPVVGPVIERLADVVRVRSGAGGDEYLMLRITDASAQAEPGAVSGDAS